MTARDALDAAILAYREDPTPENRSRLMEVQGHRGREIGARDAAEWAEKVRTYDRTRNRAEDAGTAGDGTM